MSQLASFLAPGYHIRYGNFRLDLDKLTTAVDKLRDEIGDGSKYLFWRFIVDPEKKEIRVHSPYMDSARNKTINKLKLDDYIQEQD